MKTILVKDGNEFLYIKTDAPEFDIEMALTKESRGEGSFISLLKSEGYTADILVDSESEIETYYTEDYYDYED